MQTGTPRSRRLKKSLLVAVLLVGLAAALSQAAPDGRKLRRMSPTRYPSLPTSCPEMFTHCPRPWNYTRCSSMRMCLVTMTPFETVCPNIVTFCATGCTPHSEASPPSCPVPKRTERAPKKKPKGAEKGSPPPCPAPKRSR